MREDLVPGGGEDPVVVEPGLGRTPFAQMISPPLRLAVRVLVGHDYRTATAVQESDSPSVKTSSSQPL
jgi:hypothetical protein